MDFLNKKNKEEKLAIGPKVEFRELRIITVKMCYGTITDNTKRNILVFWGNTYKSIPKENNFGHSILFKGDFAAKNLETSSYFCGKQIYLPPLAEDLIESEWASEEVGPNSQLEFAFLLGLVPSERPGGMSYEFTVKTLKKPAEENPLLRSMPRFNNIPDIIKPDPPKDN